MDPPSAEELDIAIAVFVYKRPQHTATMLASLVGASDETPLPLYVFADGPKTAADIGPVKETRRLVEDLPWAAKKDIRFADTNRGLANSVIAGVSEVLRNHTAAIVVEDDLVLSQFALGYFVQALRRYRHAAAVGSISGFAHPPSRLRIPRYYPYDTYFLRRNSSWGWATWRDRWGCVDWSIARWERLRRDPFAVGLMRSVSDDLPRMLDDQLNGRIDSWAVLFTLHHFLRGLFSLTPVHSYVDNIGADGTGTHSGVTNRYRNDLRTAVAKPRFPPVVFEDATIARRFADLYKRPGLVRRGFSFVKRRLSGR